jgi:hypothetical protein
MAQYDRFIQLRPGLFHRSQAMNHLNLLSLIETLQCLVVSPLLLMQVCLCIEGETPDDLLLGVQ